MLPILMQVKRVLPMGVCHYCSANKVNLCNIEEESLPVVPARKICDEDLSSFHPYTSKTFNVAAYINKSEGLQNLLHMDVNLSKIEKKPYVMQKLLQLNFETDIKDHIFFLKDYIFKEKIGEFITKNPMIFYENIEDLKVRINYLLSKNFDDYQIQSIVTRNPFWLMFSTTRIDKRLGFFQETFNLISNEVKYLAAKQPKLITYNVHHIKTNNFVIKEELGFNNTEIKTLLLAKPRLWMIDQLSLSRRFNYIHNVIKIPHSEIVQCPNVLLCREFRVKQRHMFLETLGRAQFDPHKENYIPIIALVEGTDVEFCNKFVKCTVDDFNTFLKTI